MNLREAPGAYIWAAVSSAVVVALVQIVIGDGIDWLVLAFITVGAVVGTHIGIRRREARARAEDASGQE